TPCATHRRGPMARLRVTRTQSDGHISYQAEDANDLLPWAADADLKVVGQPYSRVEGVDKVTGRARYAYDQRLPGQLVARVLRSPRPHARIRRIDTSAAEALPGVHAVLSSANCQAVKWYAEQVPLFDTTLRLVGDEVAAVAAESEDIAQ